MPGITGIISRQPNETALKQRDIMLNCMLHEDYYTSGRYDKPDLGISIGFTSLEGSFSDCMPAFNEEKNIVLFISGECYFDTQEISRLKNSGHHIEAPDASLLVHLYEEKGAALFDNLNGWYTGLLIDLRSNRTFLFNDRYGLRRLYYYSDGEAFYFSSEAKSLLRILPELKQLNEESVAEYLVYDCVLGNRSYFKNIDLLPPGSVWEIFRGEIQNRKTFDPGGLESQESLDKSEFFDALNDTFQKIVPRYFSGSSVGMSLTGGLDTRMILAALHPGPGTLPCYTFGGSYRDILDVRLAPQVAAACGQTHKTLRIDDSRFLADFPAKLEQSIYVTDGICSVDKTDVLSFNELAREVAPIRITGKYGSQVLKDVTGFQDRSPSDAIINPGFLHRLNEARTSCAAFQRADPFSFLLYREIPWWWNGFISAETSKVTVRSPYLDNDLIRLLYRSPNRSSAYGTKLQLKTISQNDKKLMHLPTNGTYGGDGSHLSSGAVKNYYKFLTNLDKMFIRERVPYGMTHWIPRIESCLNIFKIDRLILGHTDFRRYRTWFRNELSVYLQDILLSRKTLERGYWNRDVVRKCLDAHIKGKGTYLREIRKVLQIEMIHRTMLER